MYRGRGSGRVPVETKTRRDSGGLFLDGESGFGLQNSKPFLTITVSEGLQNIDSSSRNSDGEAKCTKARLGDLVDLFQSRNEICEAFQVSVLLQYAVFQRQSPLQGTLRLQSCINEALEGQSDSI